MKTSEVFGISSSVHVASYVDRNNLDSRIKRLLRRETHIALKGASKCGKSWLRQACITNSIVVQCRLGMTTDDIYRNTLYNLGIDCDNAQTVKKSLSGTIGGSGKVKIPIVASAEVKASGNYTTETTVSGDDYKTSISNLKFVAESINLSSQRLIIEDFHYLSMEERKKLAFDLKTLWDYRCYVVIIGVWTQTNLLTYMNPDLQGRIEEVPITWSSDEMRAVIAKGCKALNIEIDNKITNMLVNDSFSNVGILQSLLLRLIEDEAEIEDRCSAIVRISSGELFMNAAKKYASQLDGTYQQFAKILSDGIRNRNKSTGIYAYTMQAIVDAPDERLMSGFRRNDIYIATHEKEPRIQKGNLKTILLKIEELQIKNNERSMVISYDESIDAVFVVDLQLLFYRKHHTMNWPWEAMVDENLQDSSFEADNE